MNITRKAILQNMPDIDLTKEFLALTHLIDSCASRASQDIHLFNEILNRNTRRTSSSLLRAISAASNGLLDHRTISALLRSLNITTPAQWKREHSKSYQAAKKYGLYPKVSRL